MAELIYKYEYLPENIRLEFTAPDRLPGKRADIVIFRDAMALEPYFVFEVKAADASDSVMAQALKQACGYRAALGAAFGGGSVGHHYPPPVALRRPEEVPGRDARRQ